MASTSTKRLEKETPADSHKPAEPRLVSLLKNDPEVEIMRAFCIDRDALKGQEPSVDLFQHSIYHDDMHEGRVVEESEYVTEFTPGKIKDEDPRFVRVAAENQWKSRHEQGYERNTSIFDFIRAVYGPWLGRGMTQADLGSVDQSAYNALRDKVNKQKVQMPSDLILPSLREARIEALRDPQEKESLKAIRKYSRDNMRKYRMRHRQRALSP